MSAEDRYMRERSPNMTAVDIYTIQANRVDWARRQLYRYIPQLQEDDIIALVYEIGQLRNLVAHLGTIDEGLRYNPQGTGFEFDMSDIQLVALAAALQSLGEVMMPD